MEEIKTFRDHRNEIAYELPFLLTSQGFEIKLEYFQKIRRLLHKIDVFWARNDVLFSPGTLEEIDIHEISDEEMISMRVAMLDVIADTIVTDLSQRVNSKQNI